MTYTLGDSYALRRRPDPRIGRHIQIALGDARSVLLAAGLASGRWHDRNGHLLDRTGYDIGYRLVQTHRPQCPG